MERSYLTVTAMALALALALMLVGPTTGWARAEIVSLGGTVCFFDMGLRVSATVDHGSLKCALELTGHELANVRLGARDAVRWGSCRTRGRTGSLRAAAQSVRGNRTC
jgi:hypothetical protein